MVEEEKLMCVNLIRKMRHIYKNQRTGHHAIGPVEEVKNKTTHLV